MPNVLEPGFGSAIDPTAGWGSVPSSGEVGDLGFGAPYTIESIVDPDGDGEANLFVVATEVFFEVGASRRPAIEVGAEGGYFLEFVCSTTIFESEVDYVVKFRSSTLAEYPDLEPGAYSAVWESPYTVRSVRGGRAIRVTTPAMPHGYGSDALYDAVVTGGLLGELVLANAVNVLPMQASLEVISMRTLPKEVYKPWGALGPYSGSNEA